MKCHVCGFEMEAEVTSLPFKVSDKSIVILTNFPVLQCVNCREYLLDDPVMKRLEEIFHNVDKAAELEIIRYAA